MQKEKSRIVAISPAKFIAGCMIVSLAVLAAGKFFTMPGWALAVEVFATIISLFIFGSIKYRIEKNALTYGAALVIFATFWVNWWEGSSLRNSLALNDYHAVITFIRRYALSLRGLDYLIHADTMLFILGLTFFVAAIAQTRILESASFAVLKKSKGGVLATIAVLTGIVAFASGILDGVSMIGLMIRTMVIILFFAKVEDAAVVFAVIISTVVTTVCGMWLAYGEPPNLIMKANLYPYLENAFFLRYCLPAAIGSYCVVLYNLRKTLRGKKVNMAGMDVLDMQTADIRFLQALRHGEVLTPVEFIEEHEGQIGSLAGPILKRLKEGEPLGCAMIRESVPSDLRRELLGKYIAEDISAALDIHYSHIVNGNREALFQSENEILGTLKSTKRRRIRAQIVGAVSFIPFIGFLVWHAIDHAVPLFWSSFAGFFIALFGILHIPKTRNLALKEALHEYAEYLFLLPLFFSITLLQKTGFFAKLSVLLLEGTKVLGASHVAYMQYAGATFLSAILDNNVVADFTSRALAGLQTGTLHLFAMAQIAGYATGGCWTHIGSAQSVVAYAFLRKEIDETYTPAQWIKAMTPVILEIFLIMTIIVYGEGLILKFLR